MEKLLPEILKLQGIEGGKLLKFIAPYTEGRSNHFQIINSCNLESLENKDKNSLNSFINLQRVNDFKGINAYFKLVNSRLNNDSYFVGCVETLEQRQKRLYNKFPAGINYIYYFIDFIYKRIFPKFKLSSYLYFALTQGKNRALSKSEILGRLVYCGFSICEIAEINNKLYFVAKRKSLPLEDPRPSTGLLLKIKRIGRHAKPITVYKFRTMHPYAQYLQEYIYNENKLSEGGKFKDDYRITKWGRWMRKFWIDELPMIYNIIRGDLKIVGVRPLSEHYLSLYTKEHKEKRILGKPGLIPPFYADMPTTLNEIMESEGRYIDAYVKKPLTTDFYYCLRAFENIFINKARSN